MTPPDDPNPGNAPPAPTFAHVSRYPTEKDLEEALGPPRAGRTAFQPRLIFQSLLEPVTGFPRKTVNLVASAQGALTLETTLEVGSKGGDNFHQTYELQRSDALDIITALAEWVASPDSISSEHSDGTPVVDFGPKNAAEARVFAEECFRVDVQVALRGFMLERNVSRPELARRMGVSEARVAAFFEDEANITIRDLARFYYALGLPTPSLHPYPRRKQTARTDETR